jgi:hypothetical protein
VGDRLNVGGGWLHEIHNWNIGNGVSLRVEVSRSSSQLAIELG